MLLQYVDLRCGIQNGGWGGCNNVLWTALEERCCYVDDVATLKMFKMLLHWRCCYVEDVTPLKMFNILIDFEDVAPLKMLKMLLRWRYCGAVAPTNTFKKALWIWRWTNGCAFCPWVSGELCHFHVINQNAEILSTRNYTGFYEINIKWRTWQI